MSYFLFFKIPINDKMIYMFINRALWLKADDLDNNNAVYLALEEY